MKDYIYKMLKLALKNETFAQEVCKKYHAFNILNLNKDWYWGYEERKCRWIIGLIEWRNSNSHRCIKRTYRRNKNNWIFYDEFYNSAYQLLRCYKNKRKFNNK